MPAGVVVPDEPIEATAITFTPTGTIAATTVQAAIAEVSTDVTDHLADTTDAHDASAISILDTANDFTATDVEGALAELQADAEADATALSNHLADTSDAHDASAISVLDTAGDYAGTDVESVLTELGTALTALRPILGEYLLPTATLYLDAAYSVAGEQSVVNQGTGGAVLDARYGSTTGVDSNDPLLLTHAAGGNYAYLPGVAGNYLSVPDEAALDITGDLEIVCRVALDDWTPAATMTVASKWSDSPGGKSWLIWVTSDGIWRLYTSVDGNAYASSASTVAPPFTDGVSYWVKVTLDVDNGAAGRDVKFWYATDQTTEPTSWTQFGATVTSAGVTALYANTADAFVGAYGTGVNCLDAKVHRTIIRDGIGGTTVLDIDCALDITDSDATSFVATTGQTVTVNRSTSGRKTVLVTRPVWLLGTDDYFEIPDSPLLDFGATDSFTVLAVVRQWATAPLASRLMSKGFPGWLVENSDPTPLSRRFLIAASGADWSASSATYSNSVLTVFTGVRNVTADNVTAHNNNTAATPSTDTTTATLAVANALYIGGEPSGYFADAELLAVAVFRRALTTTEIANLVAYWEAG